MEKHFTLFNWDCVRRVLLTCLFVFTAIGASAATAYDFEEDGIYYNYVTGAKGTEVSVTYPKFPIITI